MLIAAYFWCTYTHKLHIQSQYTHLLPGFKQTIQFLLHLQLIKLCGLYFFQQLNMVIGQNKAKVWN